MRNTACTPFASAVEVKFNRRTVWTRSDTFQTVVSCRPSERIKLFVVAHSLVRNTHAFKRFRKKARLYDYIAGYVGRRPPHLLVLSMFSIAIYLSVPR